jgi:plastocyanin
MATGGTVESRPLWQLSVGLLAHGVSLHCAAATLTVKVTDERGEPVESVAVYAMPSAQSPFVSGTEAFSLRPTAIMDQADNAFVPHLLVVQTGTSVLFPNNDSVSHHVYSFSEAKTFELGLYKGDAYPPVQFETPGVVVLGCNIHDGMLGYLVVVDTPHFSLTDAQGTVMLDGLGGGSYTVEVWTPRARPGSLPPGSKIGLGSSETAQLAVRLQGKLRPDHGHSGAGLSWDRY